MAWKNIRNEKLFPPWSRIWWLLSSKDIKSLKNISKKYSNHGLLEKIDNINEKIFKFQFNKLSKINPKKKYSYLV